MERLQKVMAQAGIASRRRSEELIVEGKVKVNGKVITELGFKVDPKKDNIEVNGELISREKMVYIMLNKPIGYITTMDDPFDRLIVLDLIKDIPQRIHPVGRLDSDTEGLLFLTNDGSLTYALTHPSHMIDKVYKVKVKGNISAKAIRNLQVGVELEDGMTAPAYVELISAKRNFSIIKITIQEGRNRQVRRMMDAVRYPVLKLTRVSMGPLTLEKLKSGNYRHLTTKEVKILKKIDKNIRN
ncbi:MAG: rRNA pseudouridine synthase [Halanaerobiales bacterium]|nr:rRNA pseudouridine synthase [Halanaerobiales bacterium]